MEVETTVCLEREGPLNIITLSVGGVIVAEWFGCMRTTQMRKPFREHVRGAHSRPRRALAKVTGKEIVEYATAMGLPQDRVAQVVNEVLRSLNWPGVSSAAEGE